MKKLTRKRGTPIAGVFVLALVLVVQPLAGVGSAGLLEDSLSPLEPLPEDPIGTVVGIVDSTLNDQPPPPPQDDGGGTTTNEPEGDSSQQGPSPSPSGGARPHPVTADVGSRPALASPNNVINPAPADQQANPPSQDEGGSARRGSSRQFMHEFNQTNYAPVGGPRSTKQVLDILKTANATPQQRARVMAPFPVLGEASYSDDWGATRYVPVPHSHEGTDIFAEKGTPVIASGDGEISTLVTGSKIAGNMIKLTAADGTYFIYSHLDGFALGISKGMKVRLGQVIGFVGNSGNAEGTVPHLHFEIHPNGGVAVPPIPYLDRWLSEALQKARALQQVPSTNSGFGAALSGLKERIAQGAAQLSGSVLETQVQGVTATNVASWGLLLTIPAVWYLRRRYRGDELPLAD